MGLLLLVVSPSDPSSPLPHNLPGSADFHDIPCTHTPASSRMQLEKKVPGVFGGDPRAGQGAVRTSVGPGGSTKDPSEMVLEC